MKFSHLQFYTFRLFICSYYFEIKICVSGDFWASLLADAARIIVLELKQQINLSKFTQKNSTGAKWKLY